MRKDEITKKKSDILKQYVAVKAFEDLIADESQTDQDFVMPEELAQTLKVDFQSVMKDMLKEEKRAARTKQRRRLTKVVALIAIVLVGAFVMPWGTVDAFRLKVFELVKLDTNEYSKITSKSKDEQKDGTDQSLEGEDDWANSYFPTYIPDGYSIGAKDDRGQNKIIEFTNGENSIFFSQYPLESSNVYLDNEDVEKGTLKINENDAYWTRKHGFTNLVWITAETGMRILSEDSVPLEELVKLAESVKLVK